MEFIAHGARKKDAAPEISGLEVAKIQRLFNLPFCKFFADHV